MLRSIIAFLFLTISYWGIAQITPEAEILIQSRHMWRGIKLGTAPAIEPSVTLTKNNFSFNVWASVTTNNSYSEVDLIPSWQLGEITFSLLDYYNPVPGENNRYLSLKEGISRHSLEFTIDNYWGDKNRLKWMAGVFLAGDKNEETGKPSYSTYLELKYPVSFLKLEAEPFVGLTPFKGLYADKFAVVNSGIVLTKKIKLSDSLSIPIVLTYTYNPYENKQLVTLCSGIVFSSGE